MDFRPVSLMGGGGCISGWLRFWLIGSRDCCWKWSPRAQNAFVEGRQIPYAILVVNGQLIQFLEANRCVIFVNWIRKGVWSCWLVIFMFCYDQDGVWRIVGLVDFLVCIRLAVACFSIILNGSPLFVDDALLFARPLKTNSLIYVGCLCDLKLC